MSEHKFKVGDRVEILVNPMGEPHEPEYDYYIGSRGTISEVESNTSIRVLGKYFSSDELELIEPAAPFTRAEIDALIDAYPDCNCLAFSEKNRNKTYLKDYSNLQFFSDRKPYSHKGRKIGFEWDEDLTDNQIRICIGYDTNLATWTKGDPLPGVVENDGCGDDCVYCNPPKTEPQTQTTHTFSAELPSGEVIKMPAPDGDGWEMVEREEFKRGDRRWISCDPNPDIRTIYQAKTHDVEDNDQTFWYCNIEENSACWASEMLQENSPILSITTWRREIQPEPPEEKPYDYPCVSRDKEHRSTVESLWPEYINEVE